MRRVLGVVCAALFICSMNASAALITVDLIDANVNNSAYFDGDLDHVSAYYWRINIEELTGGAELESASLQITGLNNIPEPDYNDILYFTLMDVNTPYDETRANQLNIYQDFGAWGNFFDKDQMWTQTSTASPYDNYTEWTNLGSFTDDNVVVTYPEWNNYQEYVVNDPENFSLDINTNLISDYMGGESNGFVALGFDADCHYEGNVSLVLNTVENVPEPSILSLIGLSLLGFIFIRRKK